MFVIILASIVRHKSHLSKHTSTQDNLKLIKGNLYAAIVLAVMFGLVWGFGFLVFQYPTGYVTAIFQYIFSLSAAAQGTLIFLLHGVCSNDARKVWKGWFSAISSSTLLRHVAVSYRGTTQTPANTLRVVSISTKSSKEAPINMNVFIF
jgi:hypothetical protein